MKKITINDIAKKLNVTPSTISRALSGNNRISTKTKELVAATALEMGYQPNAIAASLRRGKSDTIGMIVPRINRHFFSNVISGVEEILNPKGYKLFICQTGENESKEKKAVQSLLQNQVGGILLSLSIQTKNIDHLETIVKGRTPLVQFDRVDDRIECPKIINDNFNGAYLATKHLIKNGYKNIGHFGGEQSIRAYSQRYEGFLKAMKEEYMSINNDLILQNVITRETGFEEILRLKKKHKVDAILCAGDYAALGVMEGVRKLGVAIPREFGVIGFANEPFAELIQPTLSSVEQNAFEMGSKAALSLIKLINGEHVDNDQVIPVQLIPRKSSETIL